MNKEEMQKYVSDYNESHFNSEIFYCRSNDSVLYSFDNADESENVLIDMCKIATETNITVIGFPKYDTDRIIRVTPGANHGEAVVTRELFTKENPLIKQVVTMNININSR